jgi:hypothetical protein
MPNIQKSDSTLSLSQIGSELLTNIEIKPYDTRISRERPACFVFLIDQSGSMSEKWGMDNTKTKAEIVAENVNNAINELINICQKSDPKPLHYFDVCVIGYGQNDEAQILWEGGLASKTFVSPADLKENPTGIQGEIEIERRTFKGVSTVKIPVPFWFSPKAKSFTPMGAAIDLCTKILNDWTEFHQNSFPPIVINITDGEQTDCENDELIEKAFRLKETKTLYGNMLLFNIHINDDDDTVLFPTAINELPDNEQCHTLYNMSNNLPETFRRRIAHEIKKTDLIPNQQYVALSYQTSIIQFAKLLEFITKFVKIEEELIKSNWVLDLPEVAIIAIDEMLWREYPFSNTLLLNSINSKFINFQKLSSNENIEWSDELIQKYLEQWNWVSLSSNESLPFSINFISLYKPLWNWGSLSENKSVPWSSEMLELFCDNWNWKKISNNRDINWTWELIDKYQDFLDWDGKNENIFYLDNFSFKEKRPWSVELINKYHSKWNWDSLSQNSFLPWSKFFIKTFKANWNWGWLSSNKSIPWTIELIDEFENKWDWRSLSQNPNLPWSESFIDEYQLRLDWKYLSKNRGIPWTDEFISKYENNLNFEEMSSNISIPWTRDLIEKYENYLNFEEMSYNTSIHWSRDLIEKYKSRWHWGFYSGLPRNVSLPWSVDFIEQYYSMWDWDGLSINKSIPWSENLIDTYSIEFKWEGWNKTSGLSSNKSIPFSKKLVEKYSEKWNWPSLVRNDTFIEFIIPKIDEETSIAIINLTRSFYF